MGSEGEVVIECAKFLLVFVGDKEMVLQHCLTLLLI